MSWEDSFSIMVKESSAKINEAKRRLHSFDNSRMAMNTTNKTSAFSPPAFQIHPNTTVSQTASFHPIKTNGLDDPLFTSHESSSVALLHSLHERIKQQTESFDLLKSKVETLETTLKNQQKEVQHYKDDLSFLVQKIENISPEASLEEFKAEIRYELNRIKDCESSCRRDDNERQYATSERLFYHGKESEQVLDSLQEIKNRLDKIEEDLSSSQHNVENNSKMVEKNVTLLADWKNENIESMNRLCKLQNLSVDEVKHLRSKLYNVQDRVHELETSVNGVPGHSESSNRRKSESFLDNENIPNAHHRNSYVSISSDEEERSSLTNSSVDLDASDDNVDLSLEIDELNLNDNRQKRKSQSSGTDSLHSSLNPLTDSEDSFSEI
ncbi:myosin heavy chain, striated muscle-like [Dendronephthya gigantea]|uniref:myosin heavy chain, striated muscle-like n=1 Tax=Dendronephthya gigantea TaxID=151771 RepID=UPI0010697CA9|nr:myosin heavy chain, striated muscle-like [Dendronephthya gigantea]